MPIRKTILIKSVSIGTYYLFGQTLPPDFMDHKPAEIASFEKKCKNFGGSTTNCTTEITKYLRNTMCVHDAALYFGGLKKQPLFHGEIKSDLVFEIYSVGKGEYNIRIESADGIYALKKVLGCRFTD